MNVPKINATTWVAKSLFGNPTNVIRNVTSVEYSEFCVATITTKDMNVTTIDFNSSSEILDYGLVIDPDVLKSVFNNKKYLLKYYPDGIAYVRTLAAGGIHAIDFVHNDMTGGFLRRGRGAYDGPTLLWTDVIEFVDKSEFDRQIFVDFGHDGFRD